MQTEYKEKVITFVKLLQEHKIEIPIIQRDYAQGREDSIAILKSFLDALKNVIEREKEIRLDFIYGNVVNGYFQPLDGQQRLTTLFLLHWYAFNCCQDKEINNQELLSNFTYETRISSREFCEALVKNKVLIEDVNTKISEKIIDSSWFFLSWKKDPTIKAMLNTLNEIHEKFFMIKDLWRTLLEKNLISFYYVELKNIGLTDDLYIKMNARGKLLTPFENFKASLQQKIIFEGWEDGIKETEKFLYKIDTGWTDYFWERYKKNYSVDTAHMRFIAAVMMNRIAVEKVDDRAQLIQKLNEHPESLTVGMISRDSYTYLYNCYQLYCENSKDWNEINVKFPLWRHQPKENILSDIVYADRESAQNQNFSSYTLKVLFYAQTEYLLRNSEFNEEHFNEWMRVIRNVVSRGDIDKDGKRSDIVRSPQTFYGVINLVSELAQGSGNIYEYLYSHSVKSIFAREQIEEELAKAKLIIEKPNLKELLWKAEDNELLRGRIEIILYCIDYHDDRICEFNEELFSDVVNVIERYFSSDIEISADLRRAFLCIEVDGEYEFYNYWWSRWSVINGTKRKMFDKFREVEYFIYSEYRDYFKKLVLLLIHNDLSNIADKFVPPEDMPKWKIRLIKEKNLLDNARSNYIAISEDNLCCYLLKSKRPRDLQGSFKVD